MCKLVVHASSFQKLITFTGTWFQIYMQCPWLFKFIVFSVLFYMFMKCNQTAFYPSLEINETVMILSHHAYLFLFLKHFCQGADN